MTTVRQEKRAQRTRVVYDDYDGVLRVGKTGSFGWDQLGEPIGSLEEVGSASLTQLRDALDRADHTSFAVSTDRAEYFDPEYASANGITFEFKSGKLLTKIDDWFDGHCDDDTVDALERLITNYLNARRSTVESFEAYAYSGKTYLLLTYVTRTTAEPCAKSLPSLMTPRLFSPPR